MDQDTPIEGWTFKIWKDTVFKIVAAVFVLAILVLSLWPSVWSGALFVLSAGVLLLILYFFRNPKRNVIDEPGLVVGPGDGTVKEITHVREERYLDSDVLRIGLFLSILDVHVQRVPLAGTVSLVDHQPGAFLQAFRPEASEENEYIAMRLETAYGPVLVKQIAGILARRCINFGKPGQELRTGQRYGLIRFGSRVDLFLPPEAEALVSEGDQVYGGITPIARMHNHE